MPVQNTITGSICEHRECGSTISLLQPKKEHARSFYVALGTALGSCLQGYRRWVICTADERQSFR